MKDRDFLLWIHDRLTAVYGEDPLMDYMHKLRAIIWRMDPMQESLGSPFNNGTELRGAIMAEKRVRELHDMSKTNEVARPIQ